MHKLTTELLRRFAVIGVEDLNVRGMMANGKLARSIADRGFHEFRRQLDYKAVMAGSRIVVANRWYPSSKTCSDCGHVVEKLPLSVREWDCPACGAHHDRDVNAAINLKQMAESSADCCPPGVLSAPVCFSHTDRQQPVERKALAWSQDQGETGLGEAGIQRRGCS